MNHADGANQAPLRRNAVEGVRDRDVENLSQPFTPPVNI